MKVLTIKQPYASLIAVGVKKYEFRTWKTNYRGEILIHAGKSVDKMALEEFKFYNVDCPLGCIIAKGIISDVIEVNDAFRKQLEKENSLIYNHIIQDKSFKGYAFKIDNVHLIEPIYINGKLGLWNYGKCGIKIRG